jgi:hypothetical protein
VGAHFTLHVCLVNQFTDQLAHPVRSAVLGNPVRSLRFALAARDAELLAPEFHPIQPGALTHLSPFTASRRRSDAVRDRITAEPRLYRLLGNGAAVREQSRQRFGRQRHVIESRLYGGN